MVNLMQLIYWLVSSAAGSYDLVKFGSASENAENSRNCFLVLWVGFLSIQLESASRKKELQNRAKLSSVLTDGDL